MTLAVQVRCPACNAAQAPREDGRYVCDFCLQPFSVAEARQEESRLLAEIESWLQQKVGAGTAAGGIDTASRSYIFQQKILPDLRRDVDRSLEVLSGHGQFPLVQPPFATAGRAAGSPLLARRQEILRLKSLRARLASEAVSSFAITPAEQEAIQAMDRRVAEVMHLSNLAEAAAMGREEGYASARRNLEALLTDLQRSLAGERGTSGIADTAGRAAYVGALVRRYQALAELCRVCEETCGPNAVSGADLAGRLDALAPSLQTAAGEVEACGYSPAETMPVVLGIQQEVALCRLLARWLRGYDALAGRSQLPFGTFLATWEGLRQGRRGTAEAEADLLEAWVLTVQAVRGEVPARLAADFSWVDGWVETQRAKKSLGLFGDEEQAEIVERFLLPVWVADLGFSQSQGVVFKEGRENRCLAVVDACAPASSRVVFLTGAGDPLAAALEAGARPLGGVPVALPLSTEASARQALLQAARSRPDLLNPQLRGCTLAFVAAVDVHYRSRKGARQLVACLGGQVPADAQAPFQVVVGRQVLARFG